jgi:hypothetical protein
MPAQRPTIREKAFRNRRQLIGINGSKSRPRNNEKHLVFQKTSREKTRADYHACAQRPPVAWQNCHNSSIRSIARSSLG